MKEMNGAKFRSFVTWVQSKTGTKEDSRWRRKVASGDE